MTDLEDLKAELDAGKNPRVIMPRDELRVLVDRLEAAERERDEQSELAHRTRDEWHKALRRAEAAEAKIAAVRLYCENQGDKFRYHAARILTDLQESEGE